MQLDIEVSSPASVWRASILTLLNNAKNGNIYILTERLLCNMQFMHSAKCCVPCKCVLQHSDVYSSIQMCIHFLCCKLLHMVQCIVDPRPD